jgi:hypothetical protein
VNKKGLERMPKQAKRRFVGLDTEEVSLVDTPANEVEFLVMKNTEDPSMGATAKKEVVPVDAEEAVDGDVTKALSHVNAIVDKIAGLVVGTKKEAKAPVEGEPVTDDTEGDDADGDTEPTADTETAKAASMKSVLEKCGLDAGMVKTTMAKLKAAGFSGGAPPFGKKPGGKAPEKDDSEEEKKTSKSDDAPLTMATLASAVQKAAAFTPARIKALQDAQDILKLVLEAVAPGTSPDANTPQVQTHSNPSAVAELTKPNTKPSVPTMKSEELVDTLKGLATAVNGLVTRVESIEKARPASNSADPEGATDSNARKSRSIWGGVL